MDAAQILTYLGRSGFRVGFDPATRNITVAPRPSALLGKRIIAQEAALEAYCLSLSAPPATDHTYVQRREGSFISYDGVCVSCGVPWSLHGEPPGSQWTFVDDVDEVQLLRRAPLDRSEAA